MRIEWSTKKFWCELSGGELGSTTQLKRPDALQTEVGTMGCEASVRQVAIKAI